jgi:hypothetical protein
VKNRQDQAFNACERAGCRRNGGLNGNLQLGEVFLDAGFDDRVFRREKLVNIGGRHAEPGGDIRHGGFGQPEMTDELISFGQDTLASFRRCLPLIKRVQGK